MLNKEIQKVIENARYDKSLKTCIEQGINLNC